MMYTVDCKRNVTQTDIYTYLTLLLNIAKTTKNKNLLDGKKYLQKFLNNLFGKSYINHTRYHHLYKVIIYHEKNSPLDLANSTEKIKTIN